MDGEGKRERVRRKRNIIIAGFKGDKVYEKEGIETWLEEKVNVEVKLQKIWKVNIKGKKFYWGRSVKPRR